MKHRITRVSTLIISVVILLSTVVVGYAAERTIPSAPSYWPGGAYNTIGDDDNSASSNYTAVKITAKEYPDAGDLQFLQVRDMQYLYWGSLVKVIEVPGADGTKPSDFKLTLTLTRQQDGIDITLDKADYYKPVRQRIVAADGRQCDIFIIAVPEKRTYQTSSELSDYTTAGEKCLKAYDAISDLYWKLYDEHDFPAVQGGPHPAARRSLISLSFGLEPYIHRGGTKYPISSSTNTVKEVTEDIRAVNYFSAKQAEAIFDTVFPYYIQYAQQEIPSPALESIEAANIKGVLQADGSYVLTVPDGLDMNKVQGAIKYGVADPTAVQVSLSGAWSVNGISIITLTAKDPATTRVYGDSQNGIIRSNYVIRIQSGSPAFGVNYFSAAGRIATIDDEGNKKISLHLPADSPWLTSVDVEYTGTALTYLDSARNKVAPDSLGRIDLEKAKYLVIDNDCSAFAAKGADKDSLQFSREYELDITQGNSAECDLLSYTTGIEEESIVWNGEQITVTIPYATDWSLLKSEYTCSYDAKVEAPNGEDFQNSEKTPIVYRVTAENNTTYKDYSVVVKKTPAATNNRLVAFRFGGLKGAIDHTAGTVSLELPAGTSKRFAPIIELPQYATVSPASGEVQDFTNPVTYTVTAQNGDKKEYVVTVTVSSQPADNPQKARMQDLLNGIITAYREKDGQLEDWEWLNLGLYENLQEPNTNNGFPIAEIIANRKLGPKGIMTDLARVTLMLTARGYDCSNLAQYNDGEPFVDAQGNKIDNLIANLCQTTVSLNGVQFGLLALDIGNYTLPEDTEHNRAFMVEYLLEQTPKGIDKGFMKLDGVASNMFALGPYQEDPTYGNRVRQWLEDGAQYIAQKVSNDYTIKSWGTINSEVISWTICGLCAAGIDPYTDPRFSNGSKSIVTQWLDMFSTGNGFKHEAKELSPNALATYEGCYALQWYLNFLERGGQGTPYHLWYKQHDFAKTLSSEARILGFELEGKHGVIKEAAAGGKNTITLELPAGTPLVRVTPKLTLSEGATLVAPDLPMTITANTEYNFTIRAEDGKTENVYALTVTMKDDLEASGAELYLDTLALQDKNSRALSIIGKTVTETKSGADIILNVDAGKDVTELHISADISYGATATPALDGKAIMDLSDWTSFVIKSQDGTATKTYRIKVVAKGQASISAFSLTVSGTTYKGTIDDQKGTIVVNGVDDSGLTTTKLIPSITLGKGTTVCSPAPGLEQDFSSEVRYTVNGSDVVSRTYTVNVYNKEGQRISASGGNTGPVTPATARITAFKVFGVEGVIDDSAGTITITLPDGTDVTRVAPVVTVPAGAVVSPVSGEVVNLSMPVAYTVTLGSNSRTYTVRVIYQRSTSQQLWDKMAENNTVTDHQVSKSTRNWR